LGLYALVSQHLVPSALFAVFPLQHRLNLESYAFVPQQLLPSDLLATVPLQHLFKSVSYLLVPHTLVPVIKLCTVITLELYQGLINKNKVKSGGVAEWLTRRTIYLNIAGCVSFNQVTGKPLFP
jgi:hypothetical protein